MDPEQNEEVFSSELKKRKIKYTCADPVLALLRMCAFKARVIVGEDKIRALLSTVKTWVDWWTYEHLANFLLTFFSNDDLRVYFSVRDGSRNHT